ncbi:hypothetical protein XELAEV_18011398mg [Xenopus laevis]|uniref:Helix-turn-helix domain-containing protein n=1 Tax=Xenopus laevis TaxID=8355 RepID=A0A974HXQ6_XENLA|nr:hypothetical protein XELAEV_18011398mg [Xenopus laevis]
MGSSCAPSYANLYLGWWERNFVFNEDLIEYTQNISLWLRYIDDVVVIWSGTQESFKEFVDKLNTNTINLRVTSEINKDTINFLDIRIYRGPENELKTTVYRKQTSTNSLLHANSPHPRSTIRGIPTGQYLRVRRLCNTLEDFKVESKKLYERFRERGYSHNSLKKAYQIALAKDKNSLLVPQKQLSPIKQKENKQIRLIGDFSSEHKEITRILSKYWHILEQDRDLKQIIGNRPLRTFRRSRNIGDQLTHSHYKTPMNTTWLTNKTKGCYKCGSCMACAFIQKATCITGRLDIANFKIAQFINCKTVGVIYVTKCVCGKTYVGKTKREFRRRILEHVGDVKNSRNTTVATHVNEVHNGNTGVMTFFGVEHFQPTSRVGDIDRKLLECEAKWIYWLNSKAPNGLDEGFTFSPFL